MCFFDSWFGRWIGFCDNLLGKVLICIKQFAKWKKKHVNEVQDKTVKGIIHQEINNLPIFIQLYVYSTFFLMENKKKIFRRMDLSFQWKSVVSVQRKKIQRNTFRMLLFWILLIKIHFQNVVLHSIVLNSMALEEYCHFEHHWTLYIQKSPS